jgi:hypothetical protein
MIDSDMKKALMSDLKRIVEMDKTGGKDWFVPVEKYEGELRQIALAVNEVIRLGLGDGDGGRRSDAADYGQAGAAESEGSGAAE